MDVLFQKRDAVGLLVQSSVLSTHCHPHI